MDGFEAGQIEIPVPVVPISDATRVRLITMLAAVQGFATPEEVAVLLADGGGSGLEKAERILSQDGLREEMSAHVDLLLTVLQAPESGT